MNDLEDLRERIALEILAHREVVRLLGPADPSLPERYDGFLLGFAEAAEIARTTPLTPPPTSAGEDRIIASSECTDEPGS